MNDIANILIVDDESRNIQLLNATLSDIEHVNIISSRSGMEAINLCEEQQMAIVLLDLMMPEMDGFEVIKRMRKTKLNQNTPVIIISGASFENDVLILESIEKGAIDFISKPFNPNILLGKVKHFLLLYIHQKEKERLIDKLEYYNYKARNSQMLLKKITSVAKDAIIVFDHEFKITFWNESSRLFFGYSKPEIINAEYTILLSKDEKTTRFSEIIQNYILNENKMPILQGTEEIMIVKKNGLKIPAEVSVSSFHYYEKMNFVWIVRDITERIKVHNEMLKAKELREANKIMREFMDNVSHELRTPMNAIIGISKMIIKYNSQNLTDKQIEGLELISNSGDRLLNLINDILDLSRLESKKVSVQNESFSISKLLATIKSTAIGLIDSKNLKFVIRTSNSLSEYLVADHKKLTQIILNIVGNAIKFTEKGKIEVSVHMTDSKLFFEVSDTGIGMTPEELKIIFDKFRRIEKTTTKKYKGTGLGLSISKRLIELLQGDISVTSEPGVGTIMTFWVPFMPDPEKNKNDQMPEKIVISNPENIEQNRVIIIEDDANLCYLLSNFLKNKKISAIAFNNGLEGYKAIKELKPMLIILDLDIPKMTGYDIMRKLDKLYPGKYPVLIITGLNFIPNKEKYNYDDILLKPIVENTFINSVEKIMFKYQKKIKND